MSETDQKTAEDAQPDKPERAKKLAEKRSEKLSEKKGASGSAGDSRPVKETKKTEQSSRQDKSGSGKKKPPILQPDKEQPDKEQPDKEQPQKEPPEKKAKSGRGIAALAILLALIAILMAGYIGWRGLPIEKKQPDLQAGVSELQSQLARQQAKLSDTSSSTFVLKHEVVELDQREKRLLDRVDSLSRKVRELEGSSRDQWQLAEVEYLLRLANQRLLMGDNVGASESLLVSADSILRELDDYSLFPVREALAEDLAELKAGSRFDKETTYLRLTTLSNLIPKLILLDEQRLSSPMLPAKAPTTTISESSAETWQEKAKVALMEVWLEFIGLFRVNTNREEPVEMLLSHEQELAVRQNLRLMLEQAKLAILTREQRIYQDSLEQAEQWLTRYFVRGGDASQAMINELGELKTMVVAPDLPSIHRSLDALKHVRMDLESPVPQPVAPQQKTTEPEPVIEPLFDEEVKDATPQALNYEPENPETESLKTESLKTESLKTESLKTESLETESLETESLMKTRFLRHEGIFTVSRFYRRLLCPGAHDDQRPWLCIDGIQWHDLREQSLGIVVAGGFSHADTDAGSRYYRINSGHGRAGLSHVSQSPEKACPSSV